jgi:hypothetical protein
MPPFQFEGQAEASLIFAVTMFPPPAPIKAASRKSGRGAQVARSRLYRRLASARSRRRREEPEAAGDGSGDGGVLVIRAVGRGEGAAAVHCPTTRSRSSCVARTRKTKRRHDEVHQVPPLRRSRRCHTQAGRDRKRCRDCAGWPHLHRAADAPFLAAGGIGEDFSAGIERAIALGSNSSAS